MISEADWQKALTAYLRRLMRDRNIDYPRLSQLLEEAGTPLERVALATKIRRGTFSAAFLVQVLALLGVEAIRLDDIAKEANQGD